MVQVSTEIRQKSEKVKNDDKRTKGNKRKQKRGG